MAETTDSREPSYYEVALTNRQVVIAFVVLLTCLLAAFLSGVWLGRGGRNPPPPPTVVAAPAPAEPPLEQLSFFSKPGDPPSPSTAGAPEPAPPAPAATTAPASSPPAGATPPVGSRGANPGASPAAPAATVTPAPAAPARAAASAPAPASTSRPATAAAKPTVAPQAATTAGKLWIQVYSSSNGGRARQIAAQLGKAGFAVQLKEFDKSGVKNYRVRVGPYAARADANTASTRLRHNYHLDTWVTDTP